jgi:hypothetical protein
MSVIVKRRLALDRDMAGYQTIRPFALRSVHSLYIYNEYVEKKNGSVYWNIPGKA